MNQKFIGKNNPLMPLDCRIQESSDDLDILEAFKVFDKDGNGSISAGRTPISRHTLSTCTNLVPNKDARDLVLVRCVTCGYLHAVPCDDTAFVHI